LFCCEERGRRSHHGQWPDVRGRLVEPILRDALERLLPEARLPGASYVGSYWTRTNDPEIDLIGADKRSAPANVAFVGSVKWRETAPFDSGDLEQLIRKSALVPGVGPATPLIAISRRGVERSARKLTVAFTPADLLSSSRGGSLANGVVASPAAAGASHLPMC